MRFKGFFELKLTKKPTQIKEPRSANDISILIVIIRICQKFIININN